MSFGNRLRELRTEKKMTQEELGNYLSVTKSSISGYENGTRFPDQDALKKIASLFKVSVDYLVGNTNSRNYSSEGTTEITDDHVIMTFEGKPIQPEDLELIKRLLRGKE